MVISCRCRGYRKSGKHVATWAGVETARRRSCCPQTPIPGLVPRICCGAHWRHRHGGCAAAGYSYVPTPGTSLGTWPVPRTTRALSSPSAPNTSARCGVCWTVLLRARGQTRSACPPRRSRWPTTDRTGGHSGTGLLIRRVRLDGCQVSDDSRSWRRRILHPDQQALPIEELAAADAIYGNSVILTNLDVSTKDTMVAVEHLLPAPHSIENYFRDSKNGGGLRHRPQC